MSDYGSTAPDANVELAGTFRLEIDKIQIMAFDKVQIGESTWSEQEHRSGIDPLVKQKSSGLKQPTTVTITKKLREGGAPDIKVLWGWHQKGSLDRRSGAIIHVDRTGTETMRFTFAQAWIGKMDAVEMDAANETGEVPFVFTLIVPEWTLE